MAKHFLLYYKKGTGTIVITEPRPWARENRHHFPGFDFLNAAIGHHPTTDEVGEYLIENYHFQQYESPDNLIKVLFNFNPDIDL